MIVEALIRASFFVVTRLIKNSLENYVLPCDQVFEINIPACVYKKSVIEMRPFPICRDSGEEV